MSTFSVDTVASDGGGVVDVTVVGADGDNIGGIAAFRVELDAGCGCGITFEFCKNCDVETDAWSQSVGPDAAVIVVAAVGDVAADAKFKQGDDMDEADKVNGELSVKDDKRDEVESNELDDDEFCCVCFESPTFLSSITTEHGVK